MKRLSRVSVPTLTWDIRDEQREAKNMNDDITNAQSIFQCESSDVLTMWSLTGGHRYDAFEAFGHFTESAEGLEIAKTTRPSLL